MKIQPETLKWIFVNIGTVCVTAVIIVGMLTNTPVTAQAAVGDVSVSVSTGQTGKQDQ